MGLKRFTFFHDYNLQLAASKRVHYAINHREKSFTSIYRLSGEETEKTKTTPHFISTEKTYVKTYQLMAFQSIGKQNRTVDTSASDNLTFSSMQHKPITHTPPNPKKILLKM